jgi:hyaluronate lyase
MKSGDVFSVDGSAVTPTETKTDVSASYMHFTGMGGYVFLLNETDKNTISYSKRENASYLEIFISHGVRPSGNGKAYAYVYLPEATAEQTAAYNASPDIKLVRRTNKTHAVAETKLGVLGCNIFDSQGDSFNNNSGITAVRSISASKACSIMISTNAQGQTVISVSDPTQLTPTVILDLGINATSVVSADEGVEVALSAGSARITVNTLNAKGATFSVTLK